MKFGPKENMRGMMFTNYLYKLTSKKTFRISFNSNEIDEGFLPIKPKESNDSLYK
jgi:hypothetical protein